MSRDRRRARTIGALGIVVATSGLVTTASMTTGAQPIRPGPTLGTLPHPTVTVPPPAVRPHFQAKSVSVGFGAICALGDVVSAFLPVQVVSPGVVTCWGGGPANSPTPAAVSGLSNVTSLAVGADHACAVVTGGTVVCWGKNDFCQLGACTPIGGSSTPQQVPGITTAMTVAAGAQFTCVLLKGGTVDCWGSNTAGAIGQGGPWAASVKPTPNYYASPQPVAGVSGASALFVAGSQGPWSSTQLPMACALVNQTPMCWGGGVIGGTSSTNPNTTWSAAALPLKGVTSVALNNTSACTVSASGGGCWGNAPGIGSGATQASPAAMTGAGSVTAVGNGAGFECALNNQGQVFCWGGPCPGAPTQATAVNLAEAATSISANDNIDVCAVLQSGKVQCWGFNVSGALASTPSPTACTSTPVTIPL
jgi:hypothetical protein